MEALNDHSQQQNQNASIFSEPEGTRFTPPFEEEQEQNQPQTQNQEIIQITRPESVIELLERVQSDPTGIERIEKFVKCSQEDWQKRSEELVERFSGLLSRIMKLTTYVRSSYLSPFLTAN